MTDLPAPRGICFDAYDTLLTLEAPVPRLQQLLAEAGVEVTLETAGEALAAEVAYYREHSLDGYDEASLAALRTACASKINDRVSQETGSRLEPRRMVEILLGCLHFVPVTGAAQCLEQLAALGLRLAVVSNWDCSLPHWLGEVGLHGYFMTVIASAVVGCEKPDPRIWAPALAALDCRAEQAWHVGDEPTADGHGARQAGLTPILVGAAPAGSEFRWVPRLSDLPEMVRSTR